MTVKYFKTLKEAKAYGDKLKKTSIPHTIEAEHVTGMKKDFELFKVTEYKS